MKRLTLLRSQLALAVVALASCQGETPNVAVGERAAAVTSAPSGCMITQAQCATAPAYTGTFNDATGSGSDADCMVRALQYAEWCNNPPGATTTADYYPPNAGAPSDSTTTTNATCAITQASCANHPSYAGTFFDPTGSGGGAGACLARALQYSEWCDNPPAVSTTAAYTPPNASSPSATATTDNAACVITQSQCANHPSYSGTFFDPTGSGGDASSCTVRALQYAEWCNNPPDVTTTAAYFAPNATSPSASATTTNATCMITQASCANHPSYSGTFFDATGSGGDASSCTVRALQYAEWCNNPPAVTTTAAYSPPNASAASASATTSNAACVITQSQCADHPSYSGTFFDATGSGGDASSCLVRAQQYADWCNNPPSVTTTADYYPPNAGAPGDSATATHGCAPSCAGKACGASDGCGNTCCAGSGCAAVGCAAPCQADACGATCSGVAVTGCACQASCNGKACGAPDGCGGSCCAGSGCVAVSCGACQPDACGATCVEPTDADAGMCSCAPNCSGKICGDSDGCGGSCCTGSGCLAPTQALICDSTGACDNAAVFAEAGACGVDQQFSCPALCACGVCDPAADDVCFANCGGAAPTGCPGYAAMDACGVCGGDGSGCAGCDGVDGSNARVDVCGVCGGDGTSCRVDGGGDGGVDGGDGGVDGGDGGSDGGDGGSDGGGSCFAIFESPGVPWGATPGNPAGAWTLGDGVTIAQAVSSAEAKGYTTSTADGYSPHGCWFWSASAEGWGPGNYPDSFKNNGQCDDLIDVADSDWYDPDCNCATSPPGGRCRMTITCALPDFDVTLSPECHDQYIRPGDTTTHLQVTTYQMGTQADEAGCDPIAIDQKYRCFVLDRGPRTVQLMTGSNLTPDTQIDWTTTDLSTTFIPDSDVDATCPLAIPPADTSDPNVP